MDPTFHHLGTRQIRKYRFEILFIRFTFSIVNSLSLLFLGLVLYKMKYETATPGKDYVEILKAAAAIIAPFLTMVSQGYCFPRFRKINAIQHVLNSDPDITDEEKKILYDVTK